MASDRRSRASWQIACGRRPGSRTKLARIESKATPASSTPARRSTSQSYLTLCPALGTRASPSSSRSGARSALVSGGRLRGAVPPASSPSAATCANGKYQDRPGATASDIPTRSARIGSTDVVSVSSATSGARPFPGDARCAGEDRVEIAERLEQLQGGLFADALHPRDVVRRVAHEREVVHHAFGRDAQPLARVRLVHPMLLDGGRTAPSGI